MHSYLGRIAKFLRTYMAKSIGNRLEMPYNTTNDEFGIGSVLDMVGALWKY